jgi:hypothetical protein
MTSHPSTAVPELQVILSPSDPMSQGLVRLQRIVIKSLTSATQARRRRSPAVITLQQVINTVMD